MSNKRRAAGPPHDPSDPRRLNTEGIVGPGGPHDRDAVIVDTRHAVLLENTHVSTVELYRDNKLSHEGLAIQLSGRINKTDDHVSVLFLTGSDGAAALVTELIAIMGRAGCGAEFVDDLQRRMDDLKAAGHLLPKEDDT